jgi:hypothetical protein
MPKPQAAPLAIEKGAEVRVRGPRSGESGTWKVVGHVSSSSPDERPPPHLPQLAPGGAPPRQVLTAPGPSGGLPYHHGATRARPGRVPGGTRGRGMA